MSNASLNKLIFDTTATEDSANVGAYLRASDGTLLTHSDVGGKKALDVSIADGVNVEVDLSHIDDSVRLGDGTAFFTSTSENGDIALDVHLSNTSIAVTATDLDIRNLDRLTDNVAIQDAAGDELGINADGSVNTKPAGASSAVYGNTSVTNTATDIIGTDASGRFQVMIQNLGNKDAYIGSDASVTAANGTLLAAGASMVLDAGSAVNVHGITSSGTADIRYFELVA
jgi:hypothetical protein